MRVALSTTPIADSEMKPGFASAPRALNGTPSALEGAPGAAPAAAGASAAATAWCNSRGTANQSASAAPRPSAPISEVTACQSSTASSAAQSAGNSTLPMSPEKL